MNCRWMVGPLLLMAMALAGCATGPDYLRLEISVPEAWRMGEPATTCWPTSCWKPCIAIPC